MKINKTRYVSAWTAVQLANKAIKDFEKYGLQFANENMIQNLKAYSTDRMQPIRDATWKKKNAENPWSIVYECSECRRTVVASPTANPAVEFPYCHCGCRMISEK